MNNSNFSLPFLGYGIAGLVYLVLAILLLTNLRGRLRGGLLTIAVIVTVAWAAQMTWGESPPGLTTIHAFLAEIIHDAAWIVFLSALLSGAVGAGQNWVIRYGGILLVAGILVTGVSQEIYATYYLQATGAENVLVLGSLLTSLYVLVAIEQIYRNARESQRSGLKFLCLGLGGIFAYDLFLYSNAILAGEMSQLFWGVRGFVVAMCAPLIAVAAQRTPSWSVGIFVSRQIIFYSATLFAAGLYLTIVGFVGYYIRVAGGEWGSAAQVIFFSAAIITFSVFLFSDRTRARLRVFISKHFYENKYDYREEWLRLINTLTSSDDGPPLKKRSIKALADILEAPSGVLWLRSREADEYRCVSSWNIQEPVAVMTSNDSLIVFLSITGWIVDMREYDEDSSHYKDLTVKAENLGLPDPTIIVPLIHNSELLGLVVLASVASTMRLNFEDRDLLKTAGQQIASYLAQEIATEQLAEGRQFEAFNRLTAYLMHDMKNVIAQQSLVVENAEKHKSNPDFIDDAVATIKGSVARMRRVMDHLQQGVQNHLQERVEVGKLIMQAVSQCADRVPAPRATLGDKQVWVRADRDRLLMAVYHAIRNAQDATDADGDVSVLLAINETTCSIRIIDTGAGMDEAFVRERLFKPFDSTKGRQSMGIGAYQIRETMRGLGGEVHVESRPGAGTSIILEFSQVS